MASSPDSLKGQAANALKWNLIDKIGSQLLYAVTGVVLARELSQADFGLVGAVAVFQAFGQLFVDSGFSSALIQRKDPDERDYSSVFWFNMLVACALYVVLALGAPLVADIFQGDRRIVPLARVMFLSFPVNALSMVMVSRQIKAMDVKPVAVSTNAGLFAGCVVGVAMAVAGMGAWAIVAQVLTSGFIKAAVLYGLTRWRPLAVMSMARLKSFFKVGSGVMLTSLLNTIFQNITALFTGNRLGIVPLGYFTQADKWSRMGVMSLSQVVTSTFLPVLSREQSSPGRFATIAGRVHRLTAYMLFPAMGFLAVMATPLFHALFGPKWDGAIPLFQALLLKGVFTVLSLQESNCLLALGKSGRLVIAESVRDIASLAFILLSLPFIANPPAGSSPLWGVNVFVWGQVAASVVSWATVLLMTSRAVAGRSLFAWLRDCMPYATLTLLSMAAMILASRAVTLLLSPSQDALLSWLQLIVMTIAGAAVYLGINALLRSRVQADALAYILPRRAAGKSV